MLRGPTKAAYLRFETSPDVEFEFYLATQLGMTVGQMREDMSSDEFMSWSVYYGRKAQREQLARGGRE